MYQNDIFGEKDLKAQIDWARSWSEYYLDSKSRLRKE